MSTLTAFPFIAEGSEATPGLWNRMFSQLSDNLASVNLGAFQELSIGSTPPSYLTTAAITVAVNSAFSDYLYLTDSSGARSNYVIGSRAGGTADGLNIWDASGATMIVSFSKQSVRFYQQVIGPVFDLGGALTGTYNAATFGDGSMSTESRIQAAINQASVDGIPRVYLPSSFQPFSASSVSFIAAVQMIREGGDATVYDVKAYGAAGTGLRNDASAASGMYNALPAGARAHWPAGNYLLRFPSNGSYLIAISQNTVVTTFDDAANLVMSAAAAVTTKGSELSQYLFYATGKTGIEFQGGTFSGSRTSTIDPDAGFFYGLQCSNVRIRDMTFLDSSNAYGGLIWGEAFNGSSTVTVKDWAILGCTFKRSSWCMKFQNAWYAIEIADNYFEDLDLEPPQSGYSKNGDTAYSRAIRLTGYVNSTSASGPIGNAVITGNRINRVAYAIEVWNQDATNGRNPDATELIEITGNTILSLWGIGVNAYRDVNIVGNSWKRLKLDAAAVSAYPGTVHSMTSTGGVFGAGIEARPGYGYNVVANTLDGQWVSGESPDLTGSVTGIEFGNNVYSGRNEALIAANYVQRCFDGFNYLDTQNTQLVGNTIIDCRDALTGSGGTNTSGYSANIFRANFVSHHSLQASVNCCTFVGEWNLEGNTFQGNVNGLASAALVRLNTTTARYRVANNTFLNFIGAAIQDSGLTSTYVGNYYDAGIVVSTGAGANRQVRQANKQATFHDETFVRCRAAFVANGASASGENYVANNITMFGSTLLETTDNASSNSLFLTPAALSSGGSARIYAHTGSTVLPSVAYTSEVSLGWYRSGVSRIGLSYGQLSVPDGSNTTPSIGLSSATSIGFYSSGVQTIAQSLGTLNLATNAVRLSMRTLAASAVTASAVNTNIARDEVVFTVNTASGASLVLSSGGTAWIFNSVASAILA